MEVSDAQSDVDQSDVERRRRRVKERREWAKGAHPFDWSRELDPYQDLYDDESESDAALVALPGGMDRLYVPAVEFFEEAADWQLRRIYVRRLAPMVEDPHLLGKNVTEIARSLSDLTKRHRRTVFVGTSLGGFHALLFGTLVRADAVLAMNPVTSVLPDVLEAAGDSRMDDMLRRTSASWLSTYGDMVKLWERHPAPLTVMHYPYRERLYAVQAEHIADQPNVIAVPHYEHAPVLKLKQSGELRRLLASLLWPEVSPPPRR